MPHQLIPPEQPPDGHGEELLALAAHELRLPLAPPTSGGRPTRA